MEKDKILIEQRLCENEHQLTANQKNDLLSGFAKIQNLPRLPKTKITQKRGKEVSVPETYSLETMEIFAKFCAFLRTVSSIPELQFSYFFQQLNKVVRMADWPRIFRWRAIASRQLLPSQQIYHYHGLAEDITFLLDGVYREETEEHQILREKTILFQNYLVKHTLDPDNILVGLPACPLASKNYSVYIQSRAGEKFRGHPSRPVFSGFFFRFFVLFFFFSFLLYPLLFFGFQYSF